MLRHAHFYNINFCLTASNIYKTLSRYILFLQQYDSYSKHIINNIYVQPQRNYDMTFNHFELVKYGFIRLVICFHDPRHMEIMIARPQCTPISYIQLSSLIYLTISLFHSLHPRQMLNYSVLLGQDACLNLNTIITNS